MLTVRPANQADVPALEDMLRASYSQLLRADYAPDVLAAAIDSMNSVKPELLATGTYFVACDDQVIVGAAGWSDSTPLGAQASPLRGSIRKVGVHPGALRRGVGRALMVHTHASARAAGKTWLHCLSSLTAVPFYAALGYRHLGQTEIETLAPGLRFQAIAMRYDL